jgi:hypothetical protein
MSSNGTVLEIIERMSGPETPPRIPTAQPLKRSYSLLIFLVNYLCTKAGIGTQ